MGRPSWLHGPLLLGFAMLAFGPHRPAAGQRGPGGAPSRGPGWLARKSYLDASVRLTAAEQAVVLNRLLAIEQILVQVPELAHPDGFEIAPILYGGGDPGSTGNAIASSYALMMFFPTRKIAGEGCTCIRVLINSVIGAAQLPYSDDQGDIHFEYELGEPVPGATSVWDVLTPTTRSFTTVAFTTGGKSPWNSVSREAFLLAIRAYYVGKDGKKLEELRRTFSRSRYDVWMAEAAERKAGREAVLAQLPPEESAKTRKAMEDAERGATELLQKEEAAEMAENERTLAFFTGARDRIDARIAAMSPEERSSPAWVDRVHTAAEPVFVPPGSPLSNRVVQQDPTFLRARRSRVEARIITVKFSASLTGEVPVIHNALWQAFKKLDWAALARLVEPPPSN